jgi:hypothetical protein
MEITFRRTGERRYAVVVRPERRPAVTMDPAPGFDPQLPHDLVHYAVELEHAIELGVFGQLAAGGNLRTFRRLDATPDRKLRRRGERLAREHIEELARSERLAAEALRAWTRGPRPHSDERLERVCAHLDELSARWRDLGTGGTITVHWPEPASTRALHAAAKPARRTAHRRGQTPRRA